MSIIGPLPVGDAVVALDRVSWVPFRALASESRGGRLAYDRGRLEITSPSLGHENVKSLLCRFIEVFAEEQGLDLVAAGSVTLARDDLDRGIDPAGISGGGSHAAPGPSRDHERHAGCPRDASGLSACEGVSVREQSCVARHLPGTKFGEEPYG